MAADLWKVGLLESAKGGEKEMLVFPGRYIIHLKWVSYPLTL